MFFKFIVSFFPRAVMQGIPLLFGSTGEILTEKSGNLNLGIPGIMYVGGISGVIGAFFYEQAVPAAEMNGLLIGSVNIAAYSSIATHWLPAVIGAFQRDYPQIHVNLLEGIWQEVAQWLDDRTADIGFLSYQEDMPYDWIPLAEDPMLALLPKDHPLARAKAYPLANCAVDRFIMPAKGCDDDLMALFHRTGIVPNVQFTTLESLSAMSMVEQGLGMSVMNKLITEKRICDIVMLPVDPPASITLGIALHSKADLSPAVRMFLKYAVRMLTRQKKT